MYIYIYIYIQSANKSTIYNNRQAWNKHVYNEFCDGTFNTRAYSILKFYNSVLALF